jgi:hypothetical protein
MTCARCAGSVAAIRQGVSDHHHNQGDGKRCRRHEVRKTVVNHAGAVAGAAIFSFSSVQVLRTSAVISVTFSI